MRNWIPFSCLQLLIISTCPVSPRAYNRYYLSNDYYGKLDPIGIDFAPTHAIAVYAGSESNFTVLGLAKGFSENGNDYAQYIEALHTQERNWGSPSIIIDDSPENEIDFWYERAGSWLSSWYQQVKRRSCYTIQLLLKSTMFMNQICYLNDAYMPQPPRSQYRNLVSQYERITQLKRLVPKYFRPSTTLQPFTKSEFVFLIYQLLVDLKSQAQKAYNITIRSAVIVIPPWVPYDLKKLFDEAAFLAGIITPELFDTPYSRVEMAVLTASPNSQQSSKSVIVLDHEPYHLSAHHFDMEEWHHPTERFYPRAFTYGSQWIWVNLRARLIEGLSSNTTEEKPIPQRIIPRNDLLNIINERIHIKNNTQWPKDLEFTNRSKGVNITERSGQTRLLNMTGADVQKTDEQYTAKVIEVVQYLLLRYDMMMKYFHTRPDWEDVSKLSSHEYSRLSLDVAAKVLPPTDTGSWFYNVDEVIILDNGWEVELLDQAARKALGWKDTASKQETDICIPAYEIAARGAALQAIKLVDMYENQQREAKEMQKRQALQDQILTKRLLEQGWDGVENRARFDYRVYME